MYNLNDKFSFPVELSLGDNCEAFEFSIDTIILWIFSKTPSESVIINSASPFLIIVESKVNCVSDMSIPRICSKPFVMIDTSAKTILSAVQLTVTSPSKTDPFVGVRIELSNSL